MHGLPGLLLTSGENVMSTTPLERYGRDISYRYVFNLKPHVEVAQIVRGKRIFVFARVQQIPIGVK